MAWVIPASPFFKGGDFTTVHTLARRKKSPLSPFGKGGDAHAEGSVETPIPTPPHHAGAGPRAGRPRRASGQPGRYPTPPFAKGGWGGFRDGSGTGMPGRISPPPTLGMGGRPRGRIWGNAHPYPATPRWRRATRRQTPAGIGTAWVMPDSPLCKGGLGGISRRFRHWHAGKNLPCPPFGNGGDAHAEGPGETPIPTPPRSAAGAPRTGRPRRTPRRSGSPPGRTWGCAPASRSAPGSGDACRRPRRP
jgi:hypothetical protein